MNRWRMLSAGLLLLGAFLALHAHAQEKVRRIGFLGLSNPEAAKQYLAVFRNALQFAGWVEGRNLAIDFRFADGDPTRMDRLAAELVALKPEAIVTSNVWGALSLRKATNEIPVVFHGVNDPVGSGLVRSLRTPGGNLTGTMISTGFELISKRLQILKEWLPRMSRMTLIVQDARSGEVPGLIAEMRRIGSPLGIEVNVLEVRTQSDISGAFAILERERPDAIYVYGSPLIYTHRVDICAHALRFRLPTTSGNWDFAEAGCLMTYGGILEKELAITARLVDRILRGANPAELPVEQPTEFALAINLRTANRIGLKVPPQILGRADRVIE